jgi:hypothetical protein
MILASSVGEYKGIMSKFIDILLCVKIIETFLILLIFKGVEVKLRKISVEKLLDIRHLIYFR